MTSVAISCGVVGGVVGVHCRSGVGGVGGGWRMSGSGGGGGGMLVGCTGEFPARKSKKTLFGSMYATKIGRVGRAECGFFPSPIFSYFIERHIHRNQPPGQNIRDEYTESSRRWRRSLRGHHLRVRLRRQNRELSTPSGEKRPKSIKNTTINTTMT